MRLHSTAQAQLAFDHVKVDIPSKAPNGRIYLTWRPIKAQLSCKSSGGKPTDVVLRNAKVGSGSVNLGETPGQTKKYQMKLRLPANGAPVDFWIGGASASSEDLDASLQIAGDNGKVALATIPMMVRIRKNALALTMKERFRFLRALAKMNANPTSTYMNMRMIHSFGMFGEAHHNPAFLPWHRAYLLDFERELQAIDPSVALPYWRFDQPATVLFYKFFLGTSSVGGTTAVFDPRNPLYYWKLEGFNGIARSPDGPWDPGWQVPGVAPQPAPTETGPATYDEFRDMESNPHDAAHGSWTGFLRSVPDAPRDPLFFLLHANVDRLWALWQSKDRTKRAHPDDSSAFSAVQHSGEIVPRDGHHLNDTMWPWNEISGSPRPTIALSDPVMRSSTITPGSPPAKPRVRDMIDYQGVHSSAHLGFDYDDIRFPKDP